MAGRYRSSPVTTDGIRFASRIEERRYTELRLMERAGEIFDLACHPKFEVVINGQHYCTYTADFAYLDKTQKIEIIEEVKSKATRTEPSYRLRRKAAELFHGITVTEVVR